MGLCSTKENLVNYPTRKAKSNQSKLKSQQYTSTILTDKQSRSLFQSQILKRISQKYVNNSYGLQLVYRASQNQFSAQTFHKASDGIKDTVLIVKTLNGRVFGGFTPCGWQNDTMYKYETDQQLLSFLFTFLQQNPEQGQQTVDESKAKIKNSPTKKTTKIECRIYKLTQKSKAIMNNYTNGPIFGEGHDMFITDKCNKNDNWCNLGKSYYCKYPFGSKKANESLAGQPKFLIMDYELWQIKF